MAPCLAWAEPVKTIYNPFTNKQDYITRIDSNTIIPGTNVTIQSNSNGTVTVNSTGGGGSTSCTALGLNGYQFTDANSCNWCETIAIPGNLVTTLLNCPTVVTARPCTTGIPIGLLMSITCP